MHLRFGEQWTMSESLIVSDPAVLMGKPVVAGTRITVELILRSWAAGNPSSNCWSPIPA